MGFSGKKASKWASEKERNKTNVTYHIYYLIAEGLGASVEPLYGPKRPGKIRDSVADNTATRTVLCFTPNRDMKAGLQTTLDWYR